MALSIVWGFDVQGEMRPVYGSSLKKCRVYYPELSEELYLASGSGKGLTSFPFFLSKTNWQDSWKRIQTSMKLQILVLAVLQLTVMLRGPRAGVLTQSVGIRSFLGNGGRLGLRTCSGVLSLLGAELWQAGFHQLQVDGEVRAE